MIQLLCACAALMSHPVDRMGHIRTLQFYQLCACADVTSQSGYNSQDTIFDDRATITLRMCAQV